MWIYSQDGFVAIAKFDKTKRGADEFLLKAGLGEVAIPDDLYLVRARRRGDLDDFLGNYIAAVRIVYLEDADYQYRAIVNEYQLGRIMIARVGTIDYSGLKKAVHARQDRDYYNALSGAWYETLAELDERPIELHPALGMGLGAVAEVWDA